MYRFAKFKKENGYINVLRVLAKWNGKVVGDPDHYVIEQYNDRDNEFYPLLDITALDGVLRINTMEEVKIKLDEIKEFQPKTYVL